MALKNEPALLVAADALAREHVQHRGPERDDLLLESGESSLFDRCIRDRDVAGEGGVDRDVGVLQLLTVGVSRRRVRIQQCITHVHRPDQ